MRTPEQQRTIDEANEILARNPAVETFQEAMEIAERAAEEDA